MKHVAVFDTETTGVDVETARIVTAFFGVLDAEGNVIESYNWMVRPDGYEIPEEATAVHGVSTEQAMKEGEPLGVVLDELIYFIDKAVAEGVAICAHNGSYDFTVLDREMNRVEDYDGGGLASSGTLSAAVILDSLVIDKHIDPYRKGKRNLITAAAHYGVELSEEEAHGAQADAIASGRIVQAMIPKLIALGMGGPKGVHEAQKGWKREQAASLQRYFRTKADPIQPDAIVDGSWPYIPRGGQNG